MWQNFWHRLETAQPRGLWGFRFCHIFVPDVTNFVTIVWYIKVFVIFLTEMVICYDKFCHSCHVLHFLSFVMTNFVPSLSHLTDFTILLWQILPPVCHILQILPFCYDKLCSILSYFSDFYTFFMHKMYILVFCPIFVTFFVTWDKFCHFFDTTETQ